VITRATALPGAYVIDLERHEDHRGFFARSFCRDELAAVGLDFEVVQSSLSYNIRRGTVRGLHLQKPPFAEAKLVSCLRGSVYDVIVDLRPGSPTFRKWIAHELSEATYRTLYVPPGFAHGYQTLEDHSLVLYQMTVRYEPEAASGLCWNDPCLGIRWPLRDPILSERDRSHALLAEVA
jgi:dTDP-4-dehydrorhamnose 3,5-epimerase